MTNDEARTPWPRNWPPFWRSIVHIAIATATANICLCLWIGFDWVLDPEMGTARRSVDGVLGIQFAAVLTCMVPAEFSGAGKPVRRDMASAFFLGTLVIELWGIMVAAILTAVHVPFWVKLQIAIPSLLPGVLLTFHVITWLFKKMNRHANARQVKKAFWFGSVVFLIGMVWAAVLAIPMYHGDLGPLPSWSDNAFTASISALVFFPLSYALTASLLIKAVAAPESERGEGD